MDKKHPDKNTIRVIVRSIDTGRELTGTLTKTKRGTFFRADDPVTVFKRIAEDQKNTKEREKGDDS